MTAIATKQSYVRGYHVYKDVWEAVVGEGSVCRRERGNYHDVYAVSVVKDSRRWSLAKETVACCFTAYSFERWNNLPLTLVCTCLKMFLVKTLDVPVKMCYQQNFLFTVHICYIFRFLRCSLSLLIHRYISPHVDSTSSCGNAIAGLSQLSTAVMKLQHQNMAT